MTRDEIEQSARAVLDALADGEELSTNQLAAEIVSRTDAFDTKEAVKAVYKRLDELAHGVLRNCWRKTSKPVMRFKRVCYPKQWHVPAVQVCLCPKCGHSWTV